MLDHNLRCARKPQKRQPGLEAQWVPLPAPLGHGRCSYPALETLLEPLMNPVQVRSMAGAAGSHSSPHCLAHTCAGPTLEQEPHREPETCPAAHCRCRGPTLWVQKLHRIQDTHSSTLCMQEPRLAPHWGYRSVWCPHLGDAAALPGPTP